MMRGVKFCGVVTLLNLTLACGELAPPAMAQAETKPQPAAAPTSPYVPDLAPLLRTSPSELRDVVERFSDDRAALLRRYAIENSPARDAQLKNFLSAWQARIVAIDFDALSIEARADYLLLMNRIAYELKLLEREEKILTETQPLIPFSGTIMELQESRRRMEPLDPAAAAAALNKLTAIIESTRKAVEAGAKPESKPDSKPATKAESKSEESMKTTKVVAYRAAQMTSSLRQTLEQWFRYYDGYDPLFSWWARAPYKKTDDALKAYLKSLREKIVGAKEGEDEPIIGDPIGRDALLVDLAHEMIPYTPEQLISLADREFAWCEAEMKKASQAMGLGDDWKAALERVKEQHVEPGKQADLIRDLAREAIEFVEKHELLTVPPLARDIWRIEMRSPERQKESPFFLGGEVILVSFPTDSMGHEDKLMSMRGNNVHFARATVFHELIPGHHLQGFMTARYNPHRNAFGTPFWTEGWSLYWEMLLWDMRFAKSPENRIGMLFWRMHRAARILFSLGFHLGRMTPQQCIDFLVERVGHERANATAEVRRSFNGSYPSLYQAAYMLGGLQFRALHAELVDSGKMTNREFHDAILRGGRMPVEMIRALLTRQTLARDTTASWKFAGDLPPVK